MSVQAPSGHDRRAKTDQPTLRHNQDVAWENFAPDDYWEHNYRSLRKDDQQIIQTVAAFFSQQLASSPRASLRGVDVGSGANLYPALGMLPWCKSITLTDFSPSNVAWLREHAAGRGLEDANGGWSWKPFWDEYANAGEAYLQEEDPRTALAERHEVEECSVFALPAGPFDMGTMFFVAESMTSYETEFEDATARFIEALGPGAPFAAAFMDSSEGYVVGDRSFPAVREVTKDVVAELLRQLHTDAEVIKVDVPPNDALREGYDGMIIAVGTTSLERQP